MNTLTHTQRCGDDDDLTLVGMRCQSSCSFTPLILKTNQPTPPPLSLSGGTLTLTVNTAFGKPLIIMLIEKKIFGCSHSLGYTIHHQKTGDMIKDCFIKIHYNDNYVKYLRSKSHY